MSISRKKIYIYVCVCVFKSLSTFYLFPHVYFSLLDLSFWKMFDRASNYNIWFIHFLFYFIN